MSVAASASFIASAAGCNRRQWNGAETGSMIARRMPRSLASATARSTASPCCRKAPPGRARCRWRYRRPGLPAASPLRSRSPGRAWRRAGPPSRLRRPAPPPASPRPRVLSSRAASGSAKTYPRRRARSIRRGSGRRHGSPARRMSKSASRAITRSTAMLIAIKRGLRVLGQPEIFFAGPSRMRRDRFLFESVVDLFQGLPARSETRSETPPPYRRPGSPAPETQRRWSFRCRSGIHEERGRQGPVPREQTLGAPVLSSRLRR